MGLGEERAVKEHAERKPRLTTSLSNASVFPLALVRADHTLLAVLLTLVEAKLALAAGASLSSDSDAGTDGVS